LATVVKNDGRGSLRWTKNLALGILEVAVLVGFSEIAMAVVGPVPDPLVLVAGFGAAVLVGGFVALIPMTIYLLVIEFVVPGARSPRSLAVVLGPLVLLGMIIVAQLPTGTFVADGPQVAAALAFIVVTGGVYGRFIDLPPPRRLHTSQDASDTEPMSVAGDVREC
jgi:hypothetical protein